jgi:hypothetical protein
MKQFVESPNLLETVRQEAERNSTDAEGLAASLTEEQLNWRPAPGTWSIAQCLDHLAVTGSQFVNYYLAALEKGHRKWKVSEAVRYRPTLVGGWLIRQVDPETGRNLPAPKVFRPSQEPLITNSLEKFLKQQHTFLSFVQKSEGLDYNRTRLRSPVTPLMRYSLADAFVVTVLHGRRHLGQARRVRETEGFPA